MCNSKKIAGILLFTSCVLGAQFVKGQDNNNPPVITDDQVREKITEYKPGDSHLMIVGLTTMGYVNETNVTKLNDGSPSITTKNSSIGDADRFEFSPMFLWRQNNKVLLEFEPSYTGGSQLGVNWADVSLFLAPGVIVRTGYLVLPFGIYSKRLAAGWINKLASDPIGMDMPGSDFGIEVEGGFPLGNMKWSYDVAVSNGFQIDGTGVLSNVGIVSPNQGKTFCGRLGLLPFSNSSLEIGVSALSGSTYAPTTLNLNNPNVNMYAVDLSYYKKLGGITLTAKAQYNIQKVNAQNYVNPSDSTKTFTFDNTIKAAFGQIAIRPTGFDNFVKNFELGYRYVTYSSPDGSAWGQNLTENDISLNYWLSWRQVIKVAYESVNSTTNDNLPIGVVGSTTTTNRFILQFSTQF